MVSLPQVFTPVTLFICRMQLTASWFTVCNHTLLPRPTLQCYAATVMLHEQENLSHTLLNMTRFFRPHYSPGVESASNRKEYQEYFLGGKGGLCVGLKTLPPSCTDSLAIWVPQPPGALMPCKGTAFALLNNAKSSMTRSKMTDVATVVMEEQQRPSSGGGRTDCSVCIATETQHPRAAKMHYSAAWNLCVEMAGENILHEPTASIQMLYFGSRQNGNWEKLSKFMIWKCFKLAKNLFASQAESFLTQGRIRRTVCNVNPKMKILMLFYCHMTGGSTDAWLMFHSAWLASFLTL